jgi:hypothetical protein
MRRTCTALIALVTLLLTVGSTGPSAFAISSGPLDGPASVDFGTQLVGLSTPSQTVTITNNSGSGTPITITGVGADNSDYTVGSDTCTLTTLANVGDQCTFDVTFQPGSTGSDNGTLTITDDDLIDTTPTQTIVLNGNGVTDQFSVSGAIDFGSQAVGVQSSASTVTVTNNTGYAATPGAPALSGANPGNFAASGCGGSVGAGGTCTVNVTFTPSQTGSRSATLTVAGQSVSLTGTGVQGDASLTPANTTFGSQPVSTSSATKTITLTNTGTGSLTYSSTTVSGANPGDFSVGDSDCASTVFVPVNGTCAITVQFVPTATGSRAATITVHDNAPSGTQTVNVSGTATASSMAFGPSSVTFARAIPAGTGSPGHTITVFNTTSANMPIASTSIAGTNPKSFVETGDTCSGTTLAPGGKCTVRVKFAPSSAGRRTALVEITDTGPVPPHLHELTLTGNATFPNNPKRVTGTVGCSTAHIRWAAPTATRFAGTIVVRNHAHYPTSTVDGTRVRHRSGVASDSGLKHFTTYYYRVFATYHSLTHSGKLNYSQGTRLKERTGEICRPENGTRTASITPMVTWLPAPTRNAYGFVLKRGTGTIDENYPARTHWHFRSAWHWRGVHRLRRGHTYTFYLFSYPASHPKGFFIGQTTFTVR